MSYGGMTLANVKCPVESVRTDVLPGMPTVTPGRAPLTVPLTVSAVSVSATDAVLVAPLAVPVIVTVESPG